MAPELRRFLVAVGVALVPGLVLAASYVAVARSSSDLWAALAAGGLLFLVVWCLVYVLATVRAFAGAPAEVLRKLMTPRSGPADWTSVSTAILRGGSDGPLLAVLFASVALIAATVLPRIDTLVPTGPEHVVLLVLAVSAVVLCWMVLAVGFAVHYVRLDVRHSADGRGGLDFPGTDSPQFGDYLYFSISVATTFGTTDVNVTDRTVRLTVAVQGVLAFVFNTVILALVLTALSP
jgi:uncharacterized membrane protein